MDSQSPEQSYKSHLKIMNNLIFITQLFVYQLCVIRFDESDKMFNNVVHFYWRIQLHTICIKLKDK